MTYSPGGGAVAALGDIGNVSTLGAVDGQTINYNTTGSTWYPSTPATTLPGLSDVVFPSPPSTNDVLQFGGATWGPAAAGGGGGLELVEKKTLLAATDNVTFSGLTGNSVTCYIMFAQIAEAVATNPSYYWQPNALATDQITQYVWTDVTTLGTATQTKLYLAGVPATTGIGCCWTAIIYANVATPRFYMSWSVERRSSTEPAIRAYGGMWDEQVTQMTSIKVMATQTNGIGTGSVLALYKVP